ncbi:hypothetical protein GON04_20575 [Ramlibacter sp. MAH-25]|uniref:Uncharacterized protein n=1 Tax=Ramlibacter pinisoli TaxID=2682844 RepID=A0A6N8IZ52_9BURK|nr:hypothetical protein [Ramlibacter sp. CGMCC 1.13660]MVQ31865.1 hypothetical protein [Ramlibacter pinisoli]
MARARWIRSPTWDLVWVLNALWLAPLVLLLERAYGDARNSPLDWLFFVLAVPLWFGHRISSAWLAYTTPGYRPLLRSQRRRFVALPLAIALACFGVLLAPDSVLPVPLEQRVVCLAVLDYLLVSHHFAAQHVGLLSLYRGRAGRPSDATTRRLDRWFALVVGGGFVVLANALAGSIAFQDRWIDPLLGEALSQTVVQALATGSLVLVLTLTALMLAVELRSPQPSVPRVAYVVSVATMVLLGFLHPFLFLVLWSVQHWSAAMGLTSLAASGGAQETGAHWQRWLAPVNRHGWSVLLVLAALSALLLPLLEVEAVGDDYVVADRLFGEAALWLRASPLVPALLALGFATSFIHYVLDRAAFRFSSPEVRQAARGLLERQGEAH